MNLSIEPGLGLVLSFGFVFFAMGLASILLWLRVVDTNGARKTIHVLVGHWWFIAMATMPDMSFAIIGPAVFIVLNWLVYHFHMVPAMETKESNLGTVYFPISLLILVLLTWNSPEYRWIGGLGIMVLSWGDAAAAIVGERWGKFGPSIPWVNKTLLGTGAMAGVSFLVILSMMAIFLGPLNWQLIGLAGLVALFAAVVEAVTPFGMDNLTVPLLSAGLLWVFVQ